MRITTLALLLAVLISPVSPVLAEPAATASEQARAQREARTQERIKAMQERDQRVVDEAERYMDEVREQNTDALEGGRERAEEYARNNPVDGYPNSEVRIQEEWDWDPDLDDYRLFWQYRLVYTDSFGNAQYEAYFDQNGNVTTPLRESPWRVANQQVTDALGDENDGPFQVAWGFGTDNEGREYPDTVIVQQGGRINRVQMRFNEHGVPYFWDIKDEDGEQQRYAHGLQKPTYGDDGSPLASVEIPRPITGPCEECRSLLEARNDFLTEMVPLGQRINELAQSHANLDALSRQDEIHVQSFGRIRAEHNAKLSRYRGLKSRFNQADSAWRACEDTCNKPAPDDNKSALHSGTPTPLLVSVAQDSAKICTFGDPGGPSSLQALPIGNNPLVSANSPAAGSGPASSPAQGVPTSSPGAQPASGTAAQISPSSGTASTNSSAGSSTSPGGSAPVMSAPDNASAQDTAGQGNGSGSTASAGGSGPTGSSTGAATASTNASAPGSRAGSSGGSSGPAPQLPTTSDDEESAEEKAPDNAPGDSPSQPQSPSASVVVIKASAATMAAGAKISGMSAQLVALQPASVDTAPLPSDDCGTGSCDWWKDNQACGGEWFCDETAASEQNECQGGDCDSDNYSACDGGACALAAYSDCSGDNCVPQWESECTSSGCDFTISDQSCTGGNCATTQCSGNSCGWDIGFDQGPVKCALDASGSCELRVDPVMQAAGDYYVRVDSAFEAGGSYELNIDAVNSEGITAQSNGADLTSLPSQFQQYVSDPVVIDGTTWYTLLYPTGMSAQIQAALAAIPGIGAIAIDPCWLKWKAPNDPFYNSTGAWEQDYADQWALHRIGFGPGKKNAWDLLDGKESDVVVAVIDTGLDWNHRDLAWRNIWFNADEVADNGKDDDGNGFVDDRIGWDFWAGDNRPWDEDGHGTLIAGIIAARSDNGIGIAGINPKARIMPLRAMNEFGHTRASYIARALVYAVDNSARVVNLSVGGEGESLVFRAAVDYAESKGVLVVAAAGNEAAELNSILPGAHDAVLTVAALDTQDQRAAFSNYGPQVDIAAPGIDILSLRARFTDTMLALGDVEYDAGQAMVGSDKRYYRVGGTSFASPFVTGVASLLLAKNPKLRAADLRRILRHSATDVADPGWDQLTGFGRLDAVRALKADPGYYIEAKISNLALTQQDGKSVVVVSGTAEADRFASAEVLLGPGESPERWRRVATLKKKQADGPLAAIPAAALQGGPKHFTVRLIVKHKDGTTREVRFGLDLG